MKILVFKVSTFLHEFILLEKINKFYYFYHCFILFLILWDYCFYIGFWGGILVWLSEMFG